MQSAKMSLHKHAVLLQPSHLTHVDQANINHLCPLDSYACMYNGCPNADTLSTEIS